MITAVLLAGLVGQLPSPQVQTMAAQPPGPPVTLLLLQQAPPAVPVAPSLLVSSPPVWDRAAHQVGQWLISRAAKHQHPKALSVIQAQPVTAIPQPVQYQLVTQPARRPAVVGAMPPPVPKPSPSAVASPQAASSEAAPPAPLVVVPQSDPVLLSVDPARGDAVRRLFGK